MAGITDGLSVLRANYSSSSEGDDEEIFDGKRQDIPKTKRKFSDSENEDEYSIPISKRCALFDEEERSTTLPSELVDDEMLNKKLEKENERMNRFSDTLLPLPTEIKEMFNTQVRRNDDPELHDGRIRSFPHEPGNWATYIYVPFDPGTEFLSMVNLLLEECKSAGVSMQAIGHFHISVSRTIVLRHHWIASFVSSLQSSVRHFSPFVVSLQTLEIYTNEAKTRTFLGFKVHAGCQQMTQIIHKVDRSLNEFKLPPFHKPPSLHMSIGWCIGNHSEKINAIIADLQASCESMNGDRDCRRIYVKQLEMKTGHKIFSIPF